MVNKKCCSCNESKSTEEFWKNKAKKDGLSTWCNSCTETYRQEYSEENSEKLKRNYRKANLKRNFGLTVEQYDELFDNQNGCCAVCEKHQDNFKTRLAVDHSHKTGEIRGLLCNNCNRRVVGRWTDGTLLRRAADYVGQGTGLFVPEQKRTTKRRRKKKKVDE